MELEELVRRIQKTELLSLNMSQQKLAGAFNSMFKGRGLALNSVRKYEYGDDVRDINWHVTARFRDTYINTFTEERERLIWLMIDISGSASFGPSKPSRFEQQIELAATLAFSAVSNSDRIGLIFFNDKIQRVLEPGRGMTAFWRIAKELVDAKCAGKTDINHAISFFMNVSRKSSVVFLLSDFLSSGYGPALRMLTQNHELFTIQIAHDLEKEFPDLGWFKMVDSESSLSKWVNSGSKKDSDRLKTPLKRATEYLESSLQGTTASCLNLSTSDDPILSLVKFMNGQ